MADRDGAAKRRRDRRLRMHWRHEQLALRMTLAAALHHNGARRLPGRGPRTTLCGVAGDTEFFLLYEEELGRTRPDRLFEVRPQERDQRRTVVQIVDSPQVVPSLDVPVPQMENQLVEVCRQLDTHIPRAGYRSAQDLLFPSFSQAPCAFC